VPDLKFKVKESVNLLFGTVTPTALIAVHLIILPARTNFLPIDEEFLFVSKKKRERKEATASQLWKTKIEKLK
jgi:hypothetical protein